MAALYLSDIDPFSFRYISHHGILGQKWGVRRFQNPDGTLTAAGKKRRIDGESRRDKLETEYIQHHTREYDYSDRDNHSLRSKLVFNKVYQKK